MRVFSGRRQTNVYGELHCGLVWGGSLERLLLEEVWSQADRRRVCGVPAFALSADWELLYLAVHAARHGNTSLKWLVDLDRLCARGSIDWPGIQRKAERLGWEKALRVSLSACARLFDTPIDPWFHGATQTRWRHEPYSPDGQSWSESLFLLRLLRTPFQRLHYLAIRLLIPTAADCKFLPLPAALFFLYYPLRPLRLAGKTVAAMLGACTRKLRRVVRLPAVSSPQAQGFNLQVAPEE